MTPDRIENLTDEEKHKFSIPLTTDAFRYSIDKVIEERCDEFDYTLEDDGFEIIHRDLMRVATSIYNYEVIIIKNS